jgi:hypothetical protein
MYKVQDMSIFIIMLFAQLYVRVGILLMDEKLFLKMAPSRWRGKGQPRRHFDSL